MAVIANVALTNTFDTWRTRSNQGYTRLNAFAINESSLYANTLTANVSFTSKGLGTFNQSVAVTKNITVSGNTTSNKLVVTSSSSTANLTITGTTTDSSNALHQTLSDASTISWDVALGRVATVTITASRAIAKPTNLKVGTYILKVIQGGSGNYNLTWNGSYKWTAQTAPVLSTAVGAVDIITLFSDGIRLFGSYLPDVR